VQQVTLSSEAKYFRYIEIFCPIIVVTFIVVLIKYLYKLTTF